MKGERRGGKKTYGERRVMRQRGVEGVPDREVDRDFVQVVFEDDESVPSQPSALAPFLPLLTLHHTPPHSGGRKGRSEREK